MRYNVAQEQSPAGRGPTAAIGRLKGHVRQHITPFGESSFSYFATLWSTQESTIFTFCTTFCRPGLSWGGGTLQGVYLNVLARPIGCATGGGGPVLTPIWSI